ncbi:MAG: hypothetical protein L0332_08400 [Chloroflexi bacterium]|nr:hypothetical protein [Chloroflexota bacterium]MCI0575405.1 hypothetical protein [Chloroflexota bacterium]MCI0645461.1 hypothetical protein [Chloroflexota bacterium]MCI0726728.1 hypothetical protein [Chloroflexota bacterium]
MILKFAKGASYIPDPARPRPVILEEDRRRAAERPPHPVPFHCKPWVDGQTIGWTLFYGYLTPIKVVGLPGGLVRIENLEQLIRETRQPLIFHQVVPGYFSIGIGYTLQTSPGTASLLIPANQPPPRLELVVSVIETEWYPKQLFLVFRAPADGSEIELDYKMEMARVVPIPGQEAYELQQMTESELESVIEREEAYVAEERVTPTRWVSAEGFEFTHLYKNWSRRYRQGEGNQSFDGQ